MTALAAILAGIAIGVLSSTALVLLSELPTKRERPGTRPTVQRPS